MSVLSCDPRLELHGFCKKRQRRLEMTRPDQDSPEFVETFKALSILSPV
jgi:hypothetical protein